MCNVYGGLQSTCKDDQRDKVPNPEEDLVDPAVVDCDYVVLVGEDEAEYHSHSGLYQEEQEVDWHEAENWELFLHELAKKPEFEEEGLPYQEEEPEDEAKVHCHLETNHSEGNELLRVHIWRVFSSCLKQIFVVSDVVEEGHCVADDLNDDKNEEDHNL